MITRIKGYDDIPRISEGKLKSLRFILEVGNATSMDIVTGPKLFWRRESASNALRALGRAGLLDFKVEKVRAKPGKRGAQLTKRYFLTLKGAALIGAITYTEGVFHKEKVRRLHEYKFWPLDALFVNGMINCAQVAEYLVDMMPDLQVRLRLSRLVNAGLAYRKSFETHLPGGYALTKRGTKLVRLQRTLAIQYHELLAAKTQLKGECP